MSDKDGRGQAENEITSENANSPGQNPLGNSAEKIDLRDMSTTDDRSREAIHTGNRGTPPHDVAAQHSESDTHDGLPQDHSNTQSLHSQDPLLPPDQHQDTIGEPQAFASQNSPLDTPDQTAFNGADHNDVTFGHQDFSVDTAPGPDADRTVIDAAGTESEITVSGTAGFSETEAVVVGQAAVNQAPESISLDNPLVAEDAEVGDVVGTVSAIDPEGHSLTYSLEDDAGGRFSIDGGTGEIRVAGALDYETWESHDIVVNVDDGTDVTQHAFTIQVQDVVEAVPGIEITGGNGNDALTGTVGNDTLIGGGGGDLLVGGAGDDVFEYSVDRTRGSSGAYNAGSPGSGASSPETVWVSGTNETMDTYHGGDGYDTLNMTSGNDVFYMDADGYLGRHADSSGGRIDGIELIEAGDGNDLVDLTSTRYSTGDIAINGGSGDDVLWSSSGNDRLNGDSGNDKLYGGVGDDTLTGGDGNDKLDGSYDNDSLIGGAGNDTLIGGSGDDNLSGGEGNDYAAGGAGNDTYLFGIDDGMDTFIGGDGGGWSDTITLTDGLPSGDVSDWLHLTSGTVETTDGGDIFLSEDASGTITLGEDAVLTFDGVEKIEG